MSAHVELWLVSIDDDDESDAEVFATESEVYEHHNHDGDLAYVTEFDVLDPEIAGAQDLVRCNECDDTDERMTMLEQFDGDYVCHSCDRAAMADYYDMLAEQMRAAR